MHYRYLSHPLAPLIPVYGKEHASLEMVKVRQITRGDSANVCRFTMENHWGTHIDAPAHFFEGAPAICDYPPAYWHFRKPQVCTLPSTERRLIGVTDLLNAGIMISDDADLLLIKTGFQSRRGAAAYCLENPGIRAEVGDWLRREHPSLRAIGFDFISLSSYSAREEGRKAHRSFLDVNAPGKPILLIEDMDLSSDLDQLSEVLALPLLFQGLDSAPCTILGIDG